MWDFEPHPVRGWYAVCTTGYRAWFATEVKARRFAAARRAGWPRPVAVKDKGQ
jgi:hypothetical protein